MSTQAGTEARPITEKAYELVSDRHLTYSCHDASPDVQPPWLFSCLSAISSP